MLLWRGPQGDGKPDLSLVKDARLSRRAVLGAIAASPAIIRSARASEGRVTAIDAAGREVRLDRPARKIALGGWVSLDALSLIHPDPPSLLGAWAGDAGANRFQVETFRAKFPGIADVPRVGGATIDTLNVEGLIEKAPDLVVFSRLDAYRFAEPGQTAQIAQLEAAGVPVLIVDFFFDPVRNTEPSMRALGEVVGRRREAEAFIAFYRERMGRIAERLRGGGPAAKRPTVMLHAFAARQECCWTTGPGSRDSLVQVAGGHNIGSDVLKGAIGQLSLEYLYQRDPDVYVATGGDDDRAPGQFALGRGVSQTQAQADFDEFLQRPHIAAIGAVERGKAFGLWHNFIHTPLRVAAVEAMARWIHPETFADLRPQGTLDALNAKFLAAPVEGAFWVEQRGAK